MTFESIDRDECAAPSKPGSRTSRRRQAIADVLGEHGPLTIAAVARALRRRWPATVMVVLDLDAMEEQGLVVSRWLYTGGLPGCLEYRLATAEERATRLAIEAAVVDLGKAP